MESLRRAVIRELERRTAVQNPMTSSMRWGGLMLSDDVRYVSLGASRWIKINNVVFEKLGRNFLPLQIQIRSRKRGGSHRVSSSYVYSAFCLVWRVRRADGTVEVTADPKAYFNASIEYHIALASDTTAMRSLMRLSRAGLINRWADLREWRVRRNMALAKAPFPSDVCRLICTFLNSRECVPVGLASGFELDIYGDYKLV